MQEIEMFSCDHSIAIRQIHQRKWTRRLRGKHVPRKMKYVPIRGMLDGVEILSQLDQAYPGSAQPWSFLAPVSGSYKNLVRSLESGVSRRRHQCFQVDLNDENGQKMTRGTLNGQDVLDHPNEANCELCSYKSDQEERIHRLFDV